MTIREKLDYARKHFEARASEIDMAQLINERIFAAMENDVEKDTTPPPGADAPVTDDQGEATDDADDADDDGDDEEDPLNNSIVVAFSLKVWQKHDIMGKLASGFGGNGYTVVQEP